MFKKRIISFMLVLTLVFSSVMPNVVFAEENSGSSSVTESIEEGDVAIEPDGGELDVEGLQEDIHEEQHDDELHEVDQTDDTIEDNGSSCIYCESKNIECIIKALDLYYCPDCEKYFTIGTETNDKPLSTQIKELENDIRKDVETRKNFGAGLVKDVNFHFYCYDKLNNEELFDEVFTTREFKKFPTYEVFYGAYGDSISEDKLEILNHFTFKGWANNAVIAKNYVSNVTMGIDYPIPNTYNYWTVFEPTIYTINVHKNLGENDEILETKKVSYPNLTYNYEGEELFDEQFEFLGWSYDKDATVKEFDTISLDTVESDIDIYAVWRGAHTIKYANSDSVLCFDGKSVKLKTAEDYDKKEGYTLSGWALTEGCDTPAYEPGDILENVTESYELYPVWKANGYTVTFDENGGDELNPSEYDVFYDSIFDISPTPTRKGHIFKGWNIDGQATTGSKDLEFKVFESVRYYAIWEKEKYTINIDGDEKEVSYGDIITLPTTYTPSDDTKLFDYYEDEDGNHYDLGDELFIDGEKIIKVVLKEKIEYNIRYYDGATEYTDLFAIVYDGDKAIKPTDNPTKANYDFVEWRLDDKAFDFDTIITKNIKLVALWQGSLCDVTIDGKTIQVRYGDEINLPNNSNNTPSGYELLGWDENENVTTPSYGSGAKYKVKSDTTILYPVFGISTVTVKFYNNGGLVREEQVKYGSKYIITKGDPSKYGYRFAGWVKGGSSSTYYKGNYFYINSKSDITLTAKWVKQYDVKITYIDAFDYGISHKVFKTICDEGTWFNASSVVPTTVAHKIYEAGYYVPRQEYYLKGFTTTSQNSYWNAKNYATGVAVNFTNGFEVNSDMELYAVYTARDVFISELQLGINTSDSKALANARKNGFISNSNLIFSKGDGKNKKSVYIGYKTTTNPDLAVKEIYAIKEDSYVPIDVQGNFFIRAKAHDGTSDPDLRDGHGGKFQYIFYGIDSRVTMVTGKSNATPILEKNFGLIDDDAKGKKNWDVAKWFITGTDDASLGSLGKLIKKRPK